MGDIEQLTSSKMLEDLTNFEDYYETNLQHELEDLNFESEPEDDEDEDILVINEDSMLYDNEGDSDVTEECMRYTLCIQDPNTASLLFYDDKSVLFFTEEEEEVIKTCRDPTLQTALIQNRHKFAQINELYTKFSALKNKFSQELFKKEPDKAPAKKLSKLGGTLPSKTYVWKLGSPYFKDQRYYGAPPNVDFLNKHQNKEYMIQFNDDRRWVDDDMMILFNSVKSDYYNYCVSRLNLQIRQTEQKIKSGNHDAYAEQHLEILNRELQGLLDGPPVKVPPFRCHVGIDWSKIANLNLKGRHAASVCKGFWDIYLHPDISKKNWTQQENEKIKTLAKKHKYQDWDLIAEELGTHRSGYLVCLHYFTKLCEKFKRERFTESEDELLLDVVASCRLGSYIPWALVSRYFEERSKHQIYHRYKYYLADKETIIKGTFTEAEDILLVHLTQQFGRDFGKVAVHIPHRTAIQLRNRYTNYLEKLEINLGNFTLLDDQKILDHVKEHGDKSWTIIAEEMRRTRAHVRQRYLTLKKWLTRDPNNTPADVPRRKQEFFLQHQSKRQACMSEVLKILQKCKAIPTLAFVEALIRTEKLYSSETNRRPWRVTTRRKGSSADKNLLEFFKVNCKNFRVGKQVIKEHAVKSAERIFKLFEFFEVDPSILRERKDEESLELKPNDSLILEACRELISEAHSLNPLEPQPSTSKKTDSSLQCQVKTYLPPMLSTLLMVRGLILKFEMYRQDYNLDIFSNVHLNSVKTSLEDSTLWKMEQDLLKYDSATQTQIKNERKLFHTRFSMMILWPCIMSLSFPDQLNYAEESEEPPQLEPQNDIQINAVAEGSKAGRPLKKSAKITKMVEAKKRRRLIDKADKMSATEAISDPLSDGDSVIDNVSKTSENQSTAKIKRRGPKSGHNYPIRYIPTRMKGRRKNATNQLEDPVSVSSTSEEEETVALTQTSGQRIVKLSDIKFSGANVPLITRNGLSKLKRAKKSNNIVIFEKPDFIAAGFNSDFDSEEDLEMETCQIEDEEYECMDE